LPLTPTRARDAAAAFLGKALRPQLAPEKRTSDQSGSNPAAIKRDNRTHKTGRAIRQCTSLHTIVEQDPLKKRQIQTLFTTYAKKAGIKGRSIHSLHHSIAVHLLEASQGIEYVANHLGHKNIQNTRIYAQNHAQLAPGGQL
jgi:integrase